MAIESLLQDLVNAVKENTAALGGKASASKASTEKASTTKATTEKVTTTRTKAPAKDDDGLDYETDVKPLFKDMSELCGREALVTLFKEFGATKGDQIEEEDYPTVVKKCKRAIAAAKAAAEDDE